MAEIKVLTLDHTPPFQHLGFSGFGVLDPCGKTQGRGKHTINPLPKKAVVDPPIYDTISPPLCSRNVILFRGNGHRPDKSHFLRPPKLVLEGVLYGTFPPPKIARYVLPRPPLANSQLLAGTKWTILVHFGLANAERVGLFTYG